MSYRRMFISGVALLAIVFVSQSCNNFVTAVGPDLPGASQSIDYFPLNEGFSTTYEISHLYSSNETVTYTVGKPVSFLTGTAIEWYSLKNGVKDTGYFVYSGNSLLFYSSKKAQPEVILSTPLSIGKSWSRFNSDNNDGQLQDTTTIDVQNKGDTSSNDGGVQQVSFPTNGSEMLTVDKIESVELSRAGYFSKVIRISNDAGGGARNYYWYAAGVGMIKYVLGASDPQNPQGSVEGELVSYRNAN